VVIFAIIVLKMFSKKVIWCVVNVITCMETKQL